MQEKIHQINIIKKDIVDMRVDCVVNAANSSLLMGGGVCGAIFRAAGSAKLTEACNEIGHCPTGQAVITLGFALHAKYIIHTVGPIYKDGHSGEAKLLYSCYQNSLKVLLEHGCKSIAFPLISSGIYGYPVKEAWEQALTSCLDFLRQQDDTDLKIYFTVRSDEMLEMGQKILKTDLQRD